MLSVIWGILKVIGIIFLAILGLLLAILLLVLLVPLRYEFEASGKYDKESEEPPEYLVKARVSWLLRLVCIRLRADGAGAQFKLRIFGIPIGGRRKRQPGAEQTLGKKAQRASKKEKKARKEEQGEPAREEFSEGKSQADDLPKEELPEKKPLEETCSEKSVSGEGTESEQTDKEKGFFGKLFAVIQKIRHFFSELFQNLSAAFEKIRAKIKRIFDMAGEIRDFLEAEENREAFRYVKGEAGKLFRHVFPRKLSGEIRFGLEDPAAAGKALMALGIAYPLFGKRFSVTPVFENKLYVEGCLFFKGRIRAFSLLIIGIRVWFNQKFRGLLKRGRGLKEQLGRA
ncbi:MAG: DUF2953 domain-containing protein [Lachnospiraceae bacterium]|nr:DUF2953 domain-containing protein [Lachnospiraceae bacterium]